MSFLDELLGLITRRDMAKTNTDRWIANEKIGRLCTNNADLLAELVEAALHVRNSPDQDNLEHLARAIDALENIPTN